MAQFNYKDFLERENNKTNSSYSGGSKVTFFSSLKDDGDSTIIRFVYSSVEEFEFATVHKINEGGRYKQVSCLRASGSEPIDNCPLCACKKTVNGQSKFTYPLGSKFYAKFIEYVPDDNGNLIGQAKIWERPLAFAKSLASYMSEYGDLRNMLFKIIRHGAKGDIHTSYEVMLANPAIYNEGTCPKDSLSLFDGVDIKKFAYVNKSKEELQYFVEHGSFPAKQEHAVGTSKANYTAPVTNHTETNTASQNNVRTIYTTSESNTTQNDFFRPKRY